MTLLTANDPAPFDIINPDGKAPVLLTAEHAGTAVPTAFNNLGLEARHFDPAQTNCHYAVDIGVRDLTIMLSELLDAPAILGNYSRLFVDLNRRADDTAFPTVAEGISVPGNQNLSPEDKQARLNAIYYPYEEAVKQLVKGFLTRSVIPAVLSVHSFTPVFHGEQRPWEVGYLWAQDPRLPETLIGASTKAGYVTGDNEPYNMHIIGGTAMNRMIDPMRVPNLMIEYRNDLINTKEKAAEHAAKFADIYKPYIGHPEIHSYYEGPERIFDPAAEKRYFAEYVRTLAPAEQEAAYEELSEEHHK